MPFFPRPHTRGSVKPKSSDDNSGAAAAAIGIGALVLIMLFIALEIFALYCLIRCGNLLPTWAVVLAIISFFIPGLGGIAAIAIIAYWFATDHCVK
jgi:hypothetical protein